MMICDNVGDVASRMAGGFIVTGFNPTTNCIKTCEDFSFCEDDESEWYRASTGVAEASGVVFKQNGLKVSWRVDYGKFLTRSPSPRLYPTL
mmetsp:Transcript_19791/g.65941  ORF Transcript_19791/g.65941 Transcript_19791/m.65941 type:complete len:91 (-) Transcript_19791:1722-1994(-)